MTVYATTPAAKEKLFKVAKIARTDTSAKDLFVLPKYAIPLNINIFSAVASNAGTTATVSVGKSGAATYFVDTASVLVAGNVALTTKLANMMTALTADVTVQGIYAESGTASTTGGPFYVVCEYMMPGPGEVIN